MISDSQKDFLLMPKALPTSTHYVNLRSVLPRTEWDRVRRKVYAAASFCCELCGASGKLEAHELWRFDFATKTQYLEGLVALCPNCHRIQHALLLKLQVDQGIINPWGVINHYNKLTNKRLNPDQFFALANREAKKLEVIDWESVIAPSMDELFR